MSHHKKIPVDTSRIFDNTVCAFCGSNDEDEIIYGKFIASDDISFHHNCMFLSSGLYQKGEETDGFYGFLLPDIEAELLRGKKLFCSYCRKRGATIGCSEVKCKKSFHLKCGVEHGSLNQFFGLFESFCKDHCPKQSKPSNIPKDLFCNICSELISSEELIYSPCCKNSWFHKMCLQKYAISAGLYFFKCPLCNNYEDFLKEMQFYGICVPEKDASWELEENAYQDLIISPECNAQTCLCPEGRRFTTKKHSGWTLVNCAYCGSYASHKKCGKIKMTETKWLCSECISLDKEIKDNKSAEETGSSSEDISVDGKFAGRTQFWNLSIQNSRSSCVPLSPEKTLSNCENKKSSISLDSNVVENNFVDHVCDSKIYSQKNFKDIKNLPLNLLLQRSCMNHKAKFIKKITKKRKPDVPCCSQNKKCIKSYFGHDCNIKIRL